MSDEEKKIYDRLYVLFREQRDEFDLKFEMEEFDYVSSSDWKQMSTEDQDKWMKDKEAERKEEESKMNMWRIQDDKERMKLGYFAFNA